MRVLRSVAKAFVSPNMVYNIRTQQRSLRRFGIGYFVRWNSILFDAWVRDRLNRRAYTMLNESELLATRKSDTVFVFGSGYSLNDISPSEWKQIGNHDTLGFSGFIYQKWLHVDYHLVRGWVEFMAGALNWHPHTTDYAKVLNENPYFQNTTFIMQGEYFAQFCNCLIGYRLIRPKSRIFRYTTARAVGPPTRLLSKGLRHTKGTLCDAVNFAYCMGWKHIVLVGVDLYDSRYFWLAPDKTLGFDESSGMLIPATINTRNLTYDQMHNTARNGIVKLMGEWGEIFKKEGVYMSVYNPRSLMSEVMPVYKRSEQKR